ncbi:hypothetical protein KJ942_08895 [bacterium]|nr:hypothetical protein [bacterium]MBU4024146.1 hypothetical protein [bacterium]
MYLEEKIDALMAKQTELMEMVQLFLPNLETERGIIHFLEITKNTFNTYISENIFIEGTHYKRVGNRKVFIPDEIIKLKKIGVKGKRKTKTKQDTLDYLNNKLGIIPRAGISSNLKDVS